MNQHKIMIVFGTRPEAIKMAPLVRALKDDSRFKTIVTVSGQHREMLDQVLDIFKIQPDFDLDIMKAGQDLYDVTSRVLTGMRSVIKVTNPDMILVHGDTTTSMAAALAAYYAQIPVGHVEAGLRTNNIYSPWPEEINRQLTGRIATMHFAPTSLSRDNLIDEHVSNDRIFVTGNTVIDALHLVRDSIHSDTALCDATDKKLMDAGYDISRLADKNKKMVLITGHRRENFGDGFLNICKAIKDLSIKHPDTDFAYPMHLNPNVRKPIHEIFGNDLNDAAENVFFIEPLDYTAFIRMLDLSYFVLTDSGGIQEEAPGLGKPVLVMRDTTERPEAVTAGTVRLVSTDYDLIVDNCSDLISSESAYAKMAMAKNPYGDGLASNRIIRHIYEYLNKN